MSYKPNQARPVRMTGSQAIVRCLVAEGVTHVFGVAGGKLTLVMKAISEEPSITYIGTRHEAHAAQMAAAFFHATGRIACCIAETGPGTVNQIGGVAGAYTNHLPLIALASSGQAYAAYPSRGVLMELETGAMMRPVTNWNATVHDGRRVPELMRRAFREALGGQPGPVHLDFIAEALGCPFDYDESDFETAPARYRSTERPPAPQGQIEAAATLLAEAERPLMVAGGGVLHADAAEEFRALVALAGAAGTSSQMGLGAIASDDPLFIGHGGVIGGPSIHRAFAEADLVLAVGCRLSSWLWNDDGPLTLHVPKVVQVDVDAQQIGKNAPVEIGIVADAKLALAALAEALEAQGFRTPKRDWAAGLAGDHQAYLSRLRQLPPKDGVMHPAALAEAIGQALPAGALVAYDGGHTTFWSNDLTPTAEPRSRFHDPGMGQLGFGTPYAVGIKAARPDRAVFNITGDGAFGFSLQELDTARRYGLPIIVIVHNNAAWGVIGLSQRHAGFDMGGRLEDTDYAAIARGFGGYGEVVTEVQEVAPAIRRALESGLPAVLDCRTYFDPHPHFPDFARGLGAKDPTMPKPPPKPA